ncbi:hypothetical protein D3C86_1463580 [compost metagenome]
MSDQPLGGILAIKQVDLDWRAGAPVAGNLEHGRAGQPAVRPQQVFLERAGRLAAARADIDFHRHPGQRHEGLPRLAVERQRHQRGPRIDHLEPELAGDAVAEIRGPDLRNRQTTRCHDHRAGAHRALRGQQQIVIAFTANFVDGAAGAPVHASCVTFGTQHLDHVLGAVVTEQLAAMFLMPVNVVPAHQRQEILRGVARQRRPAEMWVR